ncbi:MAG: hypothetical protein HUU15_14675 [Candidatus Brocadiae bacterium]|nr:hypothetical protein [Candidatus Brocadiia bacterium]
MRIRLLSRVLKRAWYMNVEDVVDASTAIIKGKVAAFLRTQYSRIPDLEMSLLDDQGRVLKVLHRRPPPAPG